MPNYSVTTPDNQNVSVTAPPNADSSSIFSFVKDALFGGSSQPSAPIDTSALSRPYIGNPNLSRQAARAGVGTRPDNFTGPATAFLGGLLGTAPDEQGGSVLDPSSARNSPNAAMAGYAIGGALQAAPLWQAAGLSSHLAETAGTGLERYMSATGMQQNIIQSPFMRPSVANAANPYAGLAGPDKSNMTRYMAKMQNPQFAEREGLRESGASASTTTASGGVNLVTPEDWYKAGNPLVATAGDTSLAGQRFTNVNGVGLSSPVDVQGGFQYTLQNLADGSNNAWASMEGNAYGKQTHFDKTAINTGQIPRSVFFGMNPGDSADFSTPITEMLMNQLKTLPPSTQATNLVDSMVQKEFPQFLGVRHPEAMDQLMGQNGYPQEGSGAMRKQFVWAAKQKSVDSLGFPSYQDAADAITHPMLRNSNVGDSGLSSFLTDPGADLIQNSGHNSYNRGIPGTDAQSFAASVPAKNMFPDIYAASALKQNKLGQNFTHDQIIGDIKMGHHYQMPNQQWLDQLMPVYEQELQRAIRSYGLLAPTR